MTQSEPATYTIEFDPRALKELGKLDRQIARRIKVAIATLVNTPRPVGAIQLVGSRYLWRIRAGNYRVIYTIEDERVTVLVLRVAHRREVYRTP